MAKTTAHLTCYDYDEMNRLSKVGDATPNTVVTVTVADQAALEGLFTSDFDSEDESQENRNCAWIETEAQWGGHPVTQYDYDNNGNVTSVIDAERRTTRYHYDALNRVTKIVEPAVTANTSQVTVVGEQLNDDSADGDVDGPMTTFTYDNLGNLQSTTDALGNTTDYRYDDFNRLKSVSDPALPDPNNSQILTRPTTSYTYSVTKHSTSTANFGWSVSTTDSLATTEVQHDFLGRVQYVRGAEVGGQNPLTWYDYYRDGSLESVVDPRGARTDYTYDQRGRVSQVEAPAPGTGQHGRALTKFDYDVAGQLETVTDPLGRVTTYVYDNSGRTKTVTSPDPDGPRTGQSPATRDFIYDSVGNLLEESDAFDHKTTYAYDTLHRRKSTTDALQKRTDFTYDKVGNLKTLTDPENNVTTWDYDKLDRVYTETQGSTARTLKYDAVGNLREKTDRIGRVTKYGYDKLYRLTDEKWFANASDAANDIHQRDFDFTYDVVGQMTTASDKTGSNAISKYKFAYDSLGRTTNVTQDLTGIGLSQRIVLDQLFDLNDNRLQVAAKVGGSWNNSDWTQGEVTGGTADFLSTYQFDHLDRVMSVTQQGQGGNAVANKRVDVTYDAASQLKTIGRFQDLTGTAHVASSAFTYDQAGRLTDLVHQRIPVPGSPTSEQIIADYTWEWDVANRLTRRVDGKHADETADYTYDNRDQLTRTDRSSGSDYEEYTYDDNGNRITNETELATFNYQTGTHNRLTSDGTYTYQYDNEGNRTKRTKTVGGSYTDYTWDHRNRLTRVVDKTSAGVVTMQADYAYDVFELPIASDDPAAIDELFGYTGREFDDETGLNYYRARFYDSSNGRFISEDPIGLAGNDANLSRYVENEPTRQIDPTGMYGIDFHFYTIYAVLRARGWEHAIAFRIAGWSQYVDDDPATSPWNGLVHAATTGNPTNEALLTQFHFWGCDADTATQRNPGDLRSQLEDVIGKVVAEGRLPFDRDVIRMGVLLHAFADTWSHEGFTAWRNSRINVRAGEIRPNRGHADAAEGGHAPDNPYNDIEKALEAAKSIYSLIPRGTGKHVPWHVLEKDLRDAFDAPVLRGRHYDYEQTTAEQVMAMQRVIRRRFGVNCEYDLEYFAKRRGRFLNVFSEELESTR